MTAETENRLVCANHPNRETLLRCNRCEKPICIQCSIRTPTGYRCKECVSGLQKVFETALWYDYLIAAGIAGVLSFIGSIIANFMGFFTLIIAPMAGMVIAEAVRLAIHKRRSLRLYKLAAGVAVLGAAPLLLLDILRILLYSGGQSMWGFAAILPLVWRSLYIFLVASTLYYRLKGIQVR